MRSLVLCALLSVALLAGGCDDTPAVRANAVSQADIRADVHAMAADFLAYRPMRGFEHDMPLSGAYYWQDEFVAALEPALGPVVGYKTGGHDPGPGFPVFPFGGIRGAILEGMVLPGGSAITLDQTRRGFLEADFAFRVGDASINVAETDLELLAGLDAVIPFAEIPDPYYEEGTRTINGTIVANMGSRYSFVGEPVPLKPTYAWIDRLNRFTFDVTDEHGNVIDRGRIEGWYEPLAVVRWLRDELRASGKRLEAGDLLSLGNIGIIRQLHENSPRGPAYRGDEFTLNYHGLGDEPASVTIRIDRRGD